MSEPVPRSRHPRGSVRRALALLAVLAAVAALAALPATMAAASTAATTTTGPTLDVVPTSGQPDSVVALSGTGWPEPPRSEQPVSFAAATATRPCEVAWVSDLPATTGECKILEGGQLSGQLQVPADAKPGPREITACYPDCATPRRQAFATFTVLPLRVRVPDVAGKGFEEADASLRAFGLVLDPATAPDDPAATVDTQDPAADTEVDVGSAVSVTYAVVAPTDRVKVPNLVGLTRKQARAAVRPDELVLAFDAAGTQKGRVQEQRPRPDRLVDRGTTVTVLLVRVKVQLVPVPDIVGMQIGAARDLVEGSLLVLRVDEQRNGEVETQHPPAGTLVRQGTTVGVQLVALEEDPGTPLWQWVALAAVAFLLGGAATTLGPRVRRRGPRWVHGNVAVRAVDGEPRYDALDDLPVHTVRLVHDPGETRTDLIEVP